jgi:hypothetical protein
MRASANHLLALALCAAVALRAAPVLAGDSADSASDATFKEALAAYDAGQYAEASKLFERVYRETHEPALLFNIAQASRLLGDCPRAVAYYRRFVVDAPASADRPRAESWLAELACCAAAAPTVPSGGDAGEPPPPVAPPPPAAPPPAVPPGALSLRPPPAAAPLISVAAPAPSPGPMPAPRRSRVPGVMALAGSAVLGSAATLFALQAHDDASRITDLFNKGGTWDASAIAIDEEGRRDRALSIVCFSAAAAFAAAGVTLLVWRAHSEGR